MRKNRRLISLILPLLVLMAVLVYDFIQQGIPPAQAPGVTARPETKTPPAGSTPSPVPKLALTYSSAAKFDYFMLSLSWAPEYCATSGSADPQECAVGKKLGFVLHGLWPQYQSGYPSTCSTEKIPAALQARYAGLFPSESLMVYEWGKHGTCSGLTPEAYLSLARQLKDSVAVPEAFAGPQAAFRMTASQFRQAFQAANPALPEAALELNCAESGRYLQEVYVCFGRDGSPIVCGADVQKDTRQSCPAGDFEVRAVH